MATDFIWMMMTGVCVGYATLMT